jgi:hypothetical protein
LSYSEDWTTLSDNQYYIISGNGYPSMLRMIDGSIENILNYMPDAMFVAVCDSEELSYEHRYAEIERFIKEKIGNRTLNYRIVIQHYCFETWALGNRKAIPDNPRDSIAQRGLRHFDVRREDPEHMTKPHWHAGSRAFYAYELFRNMANQKRLGYSKSNPGKIINQYFFDQVLSRNRKLKHIKSFDNFIHAFRQI